MSASTASAGRNRRKHLSDFAAGSVWAGGRIHASGGGDAGGVKMSSGAEARNNVQRPHPSPLLQDEADDSGGSARTRNKAQLDSHHLVPLAVLLQQRRKLLKELLGLYQIDQLIQTLKRSLNVLINILLLKWKRGFRCFCSMIYIHIP